MSQETGNWEKSLLASQLIANARLKYIEGLAPGSDLVDELNSIQGIVRSFSFSPEIINEFLIDSLPDLLSGDFKIPLVSIESLALMAVTAGSDFNEDAFSEAATLSSVIRKMISELERTDVSNSNRRQISFDLISDVVDAVVQGPKHREHYCWRRIFRKLANAGVNRQVADSIISNICSRQRQILSARTQPKTIQFTLENDQRTISEFIELAFKEATKISRVESFKTELRDAAKRSRNGEADSVKKISGLINEMLSRGFLENTESEVLLLDSLRQLSVRELDIDDFIQTIRSLVVIRDKMRKLYKSDDLSAFTTDRYDAISQNFRSVSSDTQSEFEHKLFRTDNVVRVILEQILSADGSYRMMGVPMQVLHLQYKVSRFAGISIKKSRKFALRFQDFVKSNLDGVFSESVDRSLHEKTKLWSAEFIRPDGSRDSLGECLREVVRRNKGNSSGLLLIDFATAAGWRELSFAEMKRIAGLELEISSGFLSGAESASAAKELCSIYKESALPAGLVQEILGVFFASVCAPN